MLYGLALFKKKDHKRKSKAACMPAFFLFLLLCLRYVSLFVTFSRRRKFNVICVHQRPRSPATNMLDLGVWMALQSVVEKMHFRQRREIGALCRTVEESWAKLESIKLENVYTRWLKVLDLIIEDEGGNSNNNKIIKKMFFDKENFDDFDSVENYLNVLFDEEARFQNNLKKKDIYNLIGSEDGEECE